MKLAWSVNADATLPRRGPVRRRTVWGPSDVNIPEGRRARMRRVRQIVLGVLPFNQLGPDPLREFQLAKRNVLVGVR